MATTINFNYKIQAEYLQMIAEDLGLDIQRPIKKNGKVTKDGEPVGYKKIK